MCWCVYCWWGLKQLWRSFGKERPAYTELSLYAQINHEGNLELVNDLGIKLGESPEEILKNLQDQNYRIEDIQYPDRLASDNQYHKQVREINSNTPARFNADGRRLHGASGCAGKVAVFAVRLDTYPIPNQKKSGFLLRN